MSCGQTKGVFHWALRRDATNIHVVLRNGFPVAFSEDVHEYEQLCASCHAMQDLEDWRERH